MSCKPKTETTLIMDYLQESFKPLWVIHQSSLGGRGLHATRTIKKGNLIFSNKPLVIAPRFDSVLKKYCTVCYEISDSCTNCEKCPAATCSEECNTSQQHQLECSFITNNWKRKIRPDCEKYSEVLKSEQMYIRFLLLIKEHKSLLSVLQTCGIKSNIIELEKLCSSYIIPEDQIRFIEFVYSIMKINSFRITNNPHKNKIPLRGLYPLSAFLNHSCVPNTRNVFRDDYSMDVYATKDIQIGEEILTCYTGLLWCTSARRCHLYKTKHFWCKCARCEDRTEMGTNLSALKCLKKECVGFLLPTVSTNPNIEWLCDNCHSKIPASNICRIQRVLGSLVGSLDLDNQFRLEGPVLERLASFIPNTNHVFIDIRLRLTLKLGFTGPNLKELTEFRLALKESLSRGILRTLAALGVGDAYLRGLLLYHLHAALAERARRTPDLYEELKAEIESTIEQAYNILQGDISAPPDLELRRRYLGQDSDKSQEERFFILDV